MDNGAYYTVGLALLSLLGMALCHFALREERDTRHEWARKKFLRPLSFLRSTNDGPDPCSNDEEISPAGNDLLDRNRLLIPAPERSLGKADRGRAGS